MDRLKQLEIFIWLEQLAALVSKSSSVAVPKFMKPFHFVTLAQILRSHPSRIPSIVTHMKSYATHMRLWKAIGATNPESGLSRRLEGTFVPLTTLDSPERAEIHASELAALVKRQGLGCSKQTFDSVFTAWVELITNCYAHSEATEPVIGLACAQAWPAGNLAQLAIIDSGIGIRASLEEAESLREIVKIENACDYATRLGVSSKLGKGHAGYGLAVTRQLAELNDGTFLLLSGSEAVMSTGGISETIKNIRNPLTGTLVVFEWKLDKALDVAKVYANWPQSEVDVNDFF